MSLLAFRKIQVGLESTRGTLVAADKKLIGGISMTPRIARHRPTEDRGSLAEFRRSADISQQSDLRYEADATYEQLIDFLLMGVKGSITPTSPGTGEARLWTFTPNLTSANSQDSYTFEYGDDSQEFECGFVVVTNLELAWAMGQPMTLRADLVGRLAGKSTFTAALSDPTVEEIVGNLVKVFIDGTWANLGTTQKSALVTGGTIRLATGVTPVWKSDNSLDFNNVSEQKRHIEIELDMTMGTDAVTEYDAYVARTARSVRVEIVGSAFVSPDDGLTRRIRVDAIGQYANEPELFGEIEGENLIRLSLSSHEDSLGNEFEFTVQNNVATA